MAAHARDVNILIWTSRKSVDHGTNDRVMIHGDVTRADGRRSGVVPHIGEIGGSRVRRPAPSTSGSRSNVVHNQAGYLARPTTKTPETQIYFINHRSGAFPVLRLRTVVRGPSIAQSSVRLDRAAENAGRVVRDSHAAAYLTNSSYLARLRQIPAFLRWASGH